MQTGAQSPERDAGLVGFAAWLAAMPGLRRATIALGLTFGSIGFLVLGRILTMRGGWVAWTLRGVLLEPIGILAILGAYAAAEPRSPFSVYVSNAIERRRIWSAVAVIVALAVVLEMFRWGTREMMVARP